MLAGWQKADPPMMKKLPVEVDVPKLLSTVGMLLFTNELDRAIHDLALITFYYLLCIGKTP